MECPFERRQVREFVRQAKAEAGAGWAMLGAPLQRALVAKRALEVLGGQAADTIATATVNALFAAMLAEAGLEI